MNIGFEEEPKMVKLNIDLDGVIASEVKALLQEYKDVFTWSYLILKSVYFESDNSL